LIGGPTNSIDYFQYINADKFITQGGTASQVVKGDGSLLTLGAGVLTALSIGAGVSGGFVRTGDTIDNIRNPLKDNIGISSVDFYNRKLFYGGGLVLATVDWYEFRLADVDGTSLNWSLKQAYDSFNQLSLDWGSGQLWNGDDGVVSVDWKQRSLYNDDEFKVLDWENRYLQGGQWTTQASSKQGGYLMSNATYISTTSSGGYYMPPAPANAGMVIYHEASTNTLIASMSAALQGVSALNSVPLGGDVSFTSRYGITSFTVTYGSYTFLGTPVTTIAAGNTITWRKVATNIIARLT